MAWHEAPHAGTARGDSPALQVAEVQQVELPAVLAVVDVVHVLFGWTDARVRLSTWSWGGLGCPALLEGAEATGDPPRGSPLPKTPSLKPPLVLRLAGHVSHIGGMAWWVLEPFCRDWPEEDNAPPGWWEGGYGERWAGVGVPEEEGNIWSCCGWVPAGFSSTRDTQQGPKVWETTCSKTSHLYLHFDSTPPRSKGHSSQAKLQFQALG